MKTEDLKKSADELVEQTLAGLGVEEEVKTEETVVTETPAAEEVIVKSEDSDEDKKKKKDEDDKKEGDDKKPAFMKSEPTIIRKSMEELASILTEDELTVISAWREEMESTEIETKVEETIVKSEPAQEDLIKSFRDQINGEMNELRKSLSDKDDLIKSLNKQVEELAAQPAHSGRAVENLAVIEKSQSEVTLTKSQVVNKMVELQKSGANITSYDVVQFETKGTFSNPHVRQLVMNACTNA